MLGGILPPRPEEPKRFEQNEYFCEGCQETLKEETVFNMLTGKFLCNDCKLKAEKESK